MGNRRCFFVIGPEGSGTYMMAEALVDAQQMITPDKLKEVIDTCKKINKIVTPQRKRGRARIT